MEVKEITVRKLVTYESYNNVSVGLTIQLKEGDSVKEAYSKAIKTIDALLKRPTKEKIEQYEEFDELPF